MILLNPKKENYAHLDEKTVKLLKKTINFFETKGKQSIKDDDHERIWYDDFLNFVKSEKLFAMFLTPQNYGGEDNRWDTYRNCFLNEILGFYGLNYWYTWQVTVLGLGPIWMGNNDSVKKKTAGLLNDGAIFAFGLSEKEHGADIYTTDMQLTYDGENRYSASGSKYYIGNANKAPLVATFGQITDTKEYVFFVVDTANEKYDCIQNLVNSQNYVAEFKLDDYPVSADNILSIGQDAWDASLNTVNIGKFNLGWASIGICSHAFYEALNHASHRRLFDSYVTDFPHIRQFFVDAYTRLVAMKLFSLRSADYMRTASSEDRRYLLYNPLVKMKVTTQGEEVINLLWDIIAAKGFEKDMYFEVAVRDIRALPKLEGTVHVNMALVVKFIKNYFFKPIPYPEISRQDKADNDAFLFQQGPARGLGKIKFHDYRLAYNGTNLPNVKQFKKQIRIFKRLLLLAGPNKEQIKDIDFLLIIGELFSLVVYGQLILENSKILEIEEEIIDQIFDFIIRDFSKFALQLYSKTSSTLLQRNFCKKMIRKPQVNKSRFELVLEKHVFALKDQYEMNK